MRDSHGIRIELYCYRLAEARERRIEVQFPSMRDSLWVSKNLRTTGFELLPQQGIYISTKENRNKKSLISIDKIIDCNYTMVIEASGYILKRKKDVDAKQKRRPSLGRALVL